jgi:hypothetical protein
MDVASGGTDESSEDEAHQGNLSKGIENKPVKT